MSHNSVDTSTEVGKRSVADSQARHDSSRVDCRGAGFRPLGHSTTDGSLQGSKASQQDAIYYARLNHRQKIEYLVSYGSRLLRALEIVAPADGLDHFRREHSISVGAGIEQRV